MQKFTTYIKAHKIISAIVIIVVIFGGYYSYQKAHATTVAPTYTLGTVQQGIINSSVSGSGQVEALSSVSVESLGSGQVTSVKVKEGDTVTAGEVIATLDERNAEIALEQAQASYDKVVNGSQTTESLTASQQSVSDAQTALANSKQNTLLQLQSEYTSIDNTISSDIDSLYQNANSSSPIFGITVTSSSNSNSASTLNTNDSSDQIRLSQDRAQMTTILSTWKNALAASTDVDTSVTASETAVNQLQPLIEDIYASIDKMYTTDTTQQSTISPYRSNVQAARTAISNAMTDIQSDQQSYQSAEQAVTTAQDQYNVTTAPALPEDITSAKASLQAAQNTYDNNIIRAPISGQIGNITIQVGDQVGSTAVATINTQELVADISLNEVDVANVKVGQKATMTFDAIDGLTMTGKVIQVGSIGTVTSGVVSYDVKISMDTSDARIKAGMTVDTDIITDTEQNALYVPSSAIKTSGTTSYVQAFTTLPAGASASSTTITTSVLPQNIIVQTGISDDTNTQITSGLTVGESIVTKTTTTAAAKTTAAATTGSLFGALGGGGARGGFSGGGAARTTTAGR